MQQVNFNGVKFTDADVVNPEDFIPANEYNPRKVRPYVIHDCGLGLAVVFASDGGSALDTAADAGKLDGYQISDSDVEDYPNEEGVTFLGSASEPFDLDGVGVIELPNPAFSFVALFNANT